MRGFGLYTTFFLVAEAEAVALAVAFVVTFEVAFVVTEVFAVAFAEGLAVTLVVAFAAAEAFDVVFAVTLLVGEVVTFLVGVGVGFLVAALAVPPKRETTTIATSNFFNRDPI